MKILVTGGAGYVGTTLIDLLLKQGYEVRCFDNLTFGIDSLIPMFRNPCFELVKGDICRGFQLASAMDGVDMIVHLAAIVGYPSSDRDPEMAQRVNVHGTEILNEVRGDIPVIYASTGSVYGKLETLCDETSKANPLTIYGRTKLEAEQLLLNSGNAMAYRFATAFGLSPRLRLDLLVNDFTYQAVVNKYLVVYEGHFRRTFLHVYDIARAIRHAIENFDVMEGQVFNCGSNNLNATKKDIADLIAEHATFNLHFSDQGHDPDERDYEVDYSRLTATGYAPNISLGQGIREMVSAFRYLRVKNPYSNVGA